MKEKRRKRRRKKRKGGGCYLMDERSIALEMMD